MKHDICFAGWFTQLPQNLCHYLQPVTVSNKHLCNSSHVLMPDKKSKPFLLHIENVTSQRHAFLVRNTLDMTYKDMVPKRGNDSSKNSFLRARLEEKDSARTPKIFSSIIFRFVVVYWCFIFRAYSFSKSSIPYEFCSITIWASIYFPHLPSPLISFMLYGSGNLSSDAFRC